MDQIQIIVLSYLLIINLIAFVLYGIDKKRAIRNEYRIRESVLLWIARLGGAIGSWLGIKLFRHKTKHTKFRIVVPLWILIWIVAIVLAVIKKCPFLKVIGNRGEQPGELKASSPWLAPPAPTRVSSLPSSAQSQLGRRGRGHRGNQTLVGRPAASAPGPGRPRVVMV